MVDRRVNVKLNLDPHNFISGLGKSSTAARAFVKSLDDGRVKAFTKSLDATRDSTSMLIRAGIAVGPALVPALAAATPAAFGLAAGLSAAATGGAVAALALSGVGDALGAINDYRLDPTVENLQKVHQTLEQMSPAAQEFVLFLDKARPALDRLQAVAAEGALPGFQDGIAELIDGLPVFEKLVGNTATALGRLASEGGEALADDPFWREFIDFIANEAGPTLELYGRVLGNFVKGAAGVIMAFDPLADDFNESLLRVSQSVAAWGTSLEDSEGFQGFVDFVRENGPEVFDTLGSIANAMIQLVQAAAPVGEVMLPVIRLLADSIALIADSPIGPVLIGIASGLSAIASVKALGQIASIQALTALIRGGAKDGQAAGIGWKAAAAGIGIFALALTDLDERAGVANTATLTLAGAMINKWAGAAGFAAGFALDAAAANDKLAESYGRVQSALDAYDLEGAAASLESFSADVDQAWSDLESIGREDFTPGGFTDNLQSILGEGDAEKSLQQMRDARNELAAIMSSLNEFRHQLSGSREPLAGYTNDLGALQQTASRIVPALEAVGYSSDEINRILTTGQGLDEAIGKVRAYFAEQDSVAGRSKAVADAIADIGNEALTSAESADQLAAALDALFSPQLGLSEATDAYTAALKGLRGEINKTNPTLRGTSQAALQNREAIRGVTQSLIDRLNAEARAGASSKRIARLLQSGRQDILKFADAAGLGRKQTAAFLRQIGLTPKLVRIIMRANFTDKERELQRFREQVDKLPPEVLTRLATPGAIKSREDVIALARELELTDKDRKILLSLIDNASGGLQGALNLARQVDGYVAVMTTIHRIQTINEVYTTHPSGGPLQNLYNADGNIYRNGRVQRFANGSEQHFAMIGRPGDVRIWNEPEAGGEAYIPLDPAKRQRSLDIWARTGHMLGVPGFARGDIRGGNKPLPDKQVNEIVRELRDRFGRQSPIVDAIERWLQRVDRADFSRRELNARIRDLARNQANPLLRQFNIGPRQEASETRSEVAELVRDLRQTYGPDSRVARMAGHRGKHLMDVARRQDRAATKHERAVDKFDLIADRQRDFMQSVRQAFTHDAFGEDIDSRAESLTQIRADANDAARVIRQFRTLGRKGLDDPVIRQLAQSGNYALIRQLAGSSRGEIRRYEQAFRRRNRNLRELGLLTGRQVFGDELHAQRRVVAHTGRTLRRLDRTLNRLEHRLERGVERGVRQGFRTRQNTQRRRRRAKAVR